MSEKSSLRIKLKQARKKLSFKERYYKSILIQERLLNWLITIRVQKVYNDDLSYPTHVAAFWPMCYEPNLFPLISDLSISINFKILLPVIEKINKPLKFRYWEPNSPMRSNNLGIQEPSEGIFLTPEILLIPSLGYTIQGDRLGYGKGYYDRTLLDLKNCGKLFTSIGVAWDSGTLNKLNEIEEHDMRLNWVITPSSCFCTNKNKA